MQSVPITTKIVNSSPSHGKEYSIQHNVIRFVSNWKQVGGWFSQGTPVSSTNKNDRLDIAELLVKVALSTIPPTTLLLLTFPLVFTRDSVKPQDLQLSPIKLKCPCINIFACLIRILMTPLVSWSFYCDILLVIFFYYRYSDSMWFITSLKGNSPTSLQLERNEMM